MEPESVMTDKMREAMIDKDGAVWEKIGGAWSMYKPAQSVPVVGEPVDLFAREKLAIEYCDQRHIVCNEDIRNLAINAFCAGYSIPAAELARLREKDAEADELRKDAERYRWLREQSWDAGELCIVSQPKHAVKLGHDCPSLFRLDAAVDAAIAQEGE